MTAAEDIKARLSIRDIGRLLGLDLPERDKVKFHSPLRPDRNPSCTICNDRLHDWSTGEAFDGIDLYCQIKGVTTAQALKELGNGEALPSRTTKFRRAIAPAASAPPRVKSWPVLETGTSEELAQVSALRKISVAALEIASERGWLRFGTSKHGRVWVVTDNERRNAQARLLSGKEWPDIEAKVKTLPGSEAARPLGINDIGSAPFVALVEGGPDFLAALELLASQNAIGTFAVVAMLGASMRIPDDCVRLMRARFVRIYRHDDQAGLDAAKRWAGQLHGNARRVEIASLEGVAGDLNDLLRIDFNVFRQHEARIKALLRRPQ